MTTKLSPIQKKFALRVREQRAKLNLSQEKLALEAGLDRTYISGIERGLRNPSLVNIGKIAKALKTTPSNLLDF